MCFFNNSDGYTQEKHRSFSVIALEVTLPLLRVVVLNFSHIFRNCHGKCCIQQEEDYFYQQIGLKFEEETNKMLHLEHGFLWC